MLPYPEIFSKRSLSCARFVAQQLATRDDSVPIVPHTRQKEETVLL